MARPTEATFAGDLAASIAALKLDRVRPSIIATILLQIADVEDADFHLSRLRMALASDWWSGQLFTRLLRHERAAWLNDDDVTSPSDIEQELQRVIFPGTTDPPTRANPTNPTHLTTGTTDSCHDSTNPSNPTTDLTTERHDRPTRTLTTERTNDEPGCSYWPPRTTSANHNRANLNQTFLADPDSSDDDNDEDPAAPLFQNLSPTQLAEPTPRGPRAAPLPTPTHHQPRQPRQPQLDAQPRRSVLKRPFFGPEEREPPAKKRHPTIIAFNDNQLDGSLRPTDAWTDAPPTRDHQDQDPDVSVRAAIDTWINRANAGVPSQPHREATQACLEAYYTVRPTFAKRLTPKQLHALRCPHCRHLLHPDVNRRSHVAACRRRTPAQRLISYTYGTGVRDKARERNAEARRQGRPPPTPRETRALLAEEYQERLRDRREAAILTGSPPPPTPAQPEARRARRQIRQQHLQDAGGPARRTRARRRQQVEEAEEEEL